MKTSRRRHSSRVMAVPLLFAMVFGFGFAHPAAGSSTSYNWLQFGGSEKHSGSNNQEPSFNWSQAPYLQLMYRSNLSGSGGTDGAPVYLSGVATASGTKNVLYYTTIGGNIVAVDAQSGQSIWVHSYPAGSCTIYNTNGISCYTTSEPAIDPNGQFVYSYGLDGKVHKYNAGTGAEVTNGGWPETATLKGTAEKGSGDLSTATAGDGTSYLYVTNAGYPGDAGDYQGHVTAINLSTGVQHVFNGACSNQAVHFVLTPGTPDCSKVQSAVWGREGVLYDPGTNRIYFATGNGLYDPTTFNWGDSVLALNPDGTGTATGPLDSYTPSEYQTLDTKDLDIGSTGPVLLPVPSPCASKHWAIQSGKDAKLRIINLDNLSGHGAAGFTGGEVTTPIDVPQGNEVLTEPAVWVNPSDGSTWVFVGNDNGTSGLKLTVDAACVPTLTKQWQVGSAASPLKATSPIVVNGVLFEARDHLIEARNATTGAYLWSDTGIGTIHWASPIVDNGVLYIADQQAVLSAYRLPPARMMRANTAPAPSGNVINLPGRGNRTITGATAPAVPAPTVSPSRKGR